MNKIIEKMQLFLHVNTFSCKSDMSDQTKISTIINTWRVLKEMKRKESFRYLTYERTQWLMYQVKLNNYQIKLLCMSKEF